MQSWRVVNPLEICQHMGIVVSKCDLFPLGILSMPEGKHMNNDDFGVWPEAILGREGEGLKLIDKISAIRFTRPAEAEEAAAFVLDKLSENRWKRCTSYNGKAQPKTYLVRLTKNLLEDFSRKKYGRPRPPKWVQDSGKTWVDLWTELCKEGRPNVEIVPRFMQRGHDRDWIKDTIKVIKARIPSCGQKLFEAVGVDDISSIKNPNYFDENGTATVTELSSGHGVFTSNLENSLVTEPKEYSYTQQGMAEAELLLMVYTIAEAVPSPQPFNADNLPSPNTTLEQKSSGLATLGQALVFKDLERCVLKMRFRDGLSIAAVAKALNKKPYDVTVLEDACLKRIREAAIAASLDFESLLEQLK